MVDPTMSKSEKDDILRVIGRSWGSVLVFGIATLVLGVLVVLRPVATIYGFAIPWGSGCSSVGCSAW